MKKKIIIVVLSIAVFALAVFYGVSYFGKDHVTDKQRKDAETTCLAMIASWETDVQAYKDGNEDAKASANKTAQDYNEFMQVNGYLFGETLPEGIYAAIEPIE